MGDFLISVAIIIAVVLLLFISLRLLGKRIVGKSNAAKWALRVYTIYLIILSVILLACGIIYAMQDWMLFQNIKDADSRDYLLGRSGYSDIEFNDENGRVYHGMMYRAADEKAPLVIYFGGNGEVSYQRMRGLEEKRRWPYFAGYHFICIDYEGYGLNGGKTGQRSMYEGALAAYDYAAALPDVDASHIAVMGYSIGTGSAVRLAAARPAAGLILVAPYAGGLDFYNEFLPIFYGPLKLLVKYEFPSYEYAPNVTCPSLVVASRGDKTIPFASSERLSKLFSGRVDFIGLDTEDHGGLFTAGVYDMIKSFLEEAAEN
jgi:pimeloyl-ACP methyl ester carboxylesterase